MSSWPFATIILMLIPTLIVLVSAPQDLTLKQLGQECRLAARYSKLLACDTIKDIY
jgi:hypothetical protein